MAIKEKSMNATFDKLVQLSLFDFPDVMAKAPVPTATKTATAILVEEFVSPAATEKEMYVLKPEHLCRGTDAQKVRANMRAIETVMTKTVFTMEDKEALAAYCGWGGLSKFFDESNPEFEDERHSLRGLVSHHWYEMAKESVLTAYYTEPHVIEAIWKMLRNAGFTGGNVLEPSCGPGHFISAMPLDLRKNSHVTAVEIDSITSKIASAIVDDDKCDVINSGIESARLRSESFDIVVGNVPFGNYSVSDRKFDRLKTKFLIHDYFLAKSLDLVRPGGIVALITTSGTLDKSSSKVREYLNERADLIGAVRLPGGAFKALGGTDVVTDILLLRKKPIVDDGKDGNDFLALDYVNPPFMMEGARSVPVNEYFVDHPEMVLGKFDTTSSRYGEVVTVKAHEDWATRLQTIANGGVFEGWLGESQVAAKMEGPVNGFTSCQLDGYCIAEDGSLHLVLGHHSEPQSHLPVATRLRLECMVKIRDCAVSLIEADTMGEDGEGLRKQLNTLYDEFVSQYGSLMKPFNRRLFSLDGRAPLLWSLEEYDDETEATRKTCIFYKPTVGKSSLSDKADSMSDAIALSYNKFAKLNIEFMGSALGREPVDILNELIENDRVFFDPVSKEYVDCEVYLSGKVRQKLIDARAAAYSDASFEKNIKALEKVVPAKVPLTDVDIRLGVNWIGEGYVRRFVSDVMGIHSSSDEISIKHNPSLAAWTVKLDSKLKKTSKVINEWGIESMPFERILSCMLNQTSPTVHEEVTELIEGKLVKKTIVNKEETVAAREKSEKIQAEFSAWIFKDTSRVKSLEEVYNLKFNGVINRQYDGSHLVIPGLSQEITLRQAQKDSIWRGLVGGNTLLALAVGGGKTLIQIILAQEAKRLGIANKPTLVVPNHMLYSFTSQYMRAFPKAKILAASKEDMEGDKRRHLLMRIATGNWDAVIMTHSTFGKIGVSRRAIDEYIRTVTDELEATVLESKDDRNMVRQAMQQCKVVKTKLESLCAVGAKDELLTFEQTGIDMITVDEADMFKNLWFQTKKKNVAGISSAYSAKAFDMFIKTRLIYSRRGYDGFGVNFATATPISNSIGEMFVMQTYLQPQRLEELGIDNFDAWAANYAREVTSIEIAPEGSGFRMHTRFSQFVNVPELMQVFGEVAEIRTKKMLNLPEPKLYEGKHILVSCKPSSEQREFVQSLVKRAEKVRSGEVPPNLDNMLCVTNDGRKAALDMRVVSANSQDYADSKVNACVKNIYKHWLAGSDKKLTQLVFCDLSTPKGEHGRFSVYEDIRSKLIALGVPEGEIAFAQSYKTDKQKDEFHRKMRAGVIRISFGSTELMGFGTNVQDLLIAEHHLDCPWRPRDVEQRDGRIIRQGNINEEVYIYRYVTESTFDGYSWQVLERKAGFIAQVLENDTGVRKVEDVTSQALSFAEVKALASGNPIIIEKAGIDAEVSKLCTLKRVWMDAYKSLQNRKENLIFGIERSQKRQVALRRAIDNGGDFSVVTIKGQAQPLTDKGCKAIAKYIKGLMPGKNWSHEHKNAFQIGTLAVHVTAWGTVKEIRRSLTLSDIGEHEFSFSFPYGSERLLEFLQTKQLHGDLNTSMEYATNHIARSRDELAEVELGLQRTFEYEDRLVKAIARQKEVDDQLELHQDDNSAVTME
jgi:N12 class adenine-specific DNA methylase